VLALGVVIVAGRPPHLDAQSIAAGTVELPRGADTVGAGGVRVLLHRVGRDVQGPVDSTVADRHGRFRIAFHPDTTALYLLSARHGGIEYFSSPVHTNPARPDTAIKLMVYDTSSSAPVAVAARHIVIPRPADDGSRTVLDLLVLRNAGLRARVSADSSQPAWGARLPSGTAGIDVGEGDLSPNAVMRRGDSVLVFAPLAPGDKQLTLQYLIPSNRLAIDFPTATGGPVDFLLEEGSAKVAGGTIAFADSQLIEGRWFHRWTGRVNGAQVMHLTLPRPGGVPRVLLVGLVGALALVLAVAGWRAVARRPAAREAPTPGHLLDALAELDARYEGREAEVPADEWERYRNERARLKAALDRALAGAVMPR
jgi:hypothetical protein